MTPEEERAEIRRLTDKIRALRAEEQQLVRAVLSDRIHFKSAGAVRLRPEQEHDE